MEVSHHLPYAHGDQNGVHVTEVDYIVEGDDQPAPELPNPEPTEVDRAVARLIAAEIEDGACLQIGIGGMPNAVCGLLLESGVRDLGVHTEMLTDGIAELYKAGRVTGSRKNLDPGKIVFTFALGSSGSVRGDQPQSRLLLPSGGLHQPAAHHHAERPRGLDQQHDADRPAGTGRVRIGRAPPYQRHRRTTAIRAWRLCVEGRQIVHLPGIHLRESVGNGAAGLS